MGGVVIEQWDLKNPWRNTLILLLFANLLTAVSVLQPGVGTAHLTYKHFPVKKFFSVKPLVNKIAECLIASKSEHVGRNSDCVATIFEKNKCWS